MLTREQIMALSGRELDAAVAERVFGLKVVDVEPITGEKGLWTERVGHWTRIGGKTYPVLDELPCYHQDLGAALAMIGGLDRHRPDEEFVLVRCRNGRWAAGWLDGCFDARTGLIDGRIGGIAGATYATAKSPAVAICRAALLAAISEKEARV